jgi:hypothetical protein
MASLVVAMPGTGVNTLQVIVFENGVVRPGQP